MINDNSVVGKRGTIQGQGCSSGIRVKMSIESVFMLSAISNHRVSGPDYGGSSSVTEDHCGSVEPLLARWITLETNQDSLVVNWDATLFTHGKVLCFALTYVSNFQAPPWTWSVLALGLASGLVCFYFVWMVGLIDLNQLPRVSIFSLSPRYVLLIKYHAIPSLTSSTKLGPSFSDLRSE